MQKGTEIWGVEMVSDCIEPTIPKQAIAILDLLKARRTTWKSEGRRRRG